MVNVIMGNDEINNYFRQIVIFFMSHGATDAAKPCGGFG